MEYILPPAERDQTIGEEIFNAISHGIGALLAVACLVVGVVHAAWNHDVWNVVGISIYGATMFLLYLFSCLYHAIVPPRAKAVLNYIDHCAIYLLIAGSYTPICLGGIRLYSPAWAWSIFGVEWGLALAGIVFQCLCINRYQILSNATYLVMGWVVLVAIYPFYKAVGFWPLFWIAAGGIFYTAGVAFYMMKTRKFAHAVWHLFVLAGTLVQYFAILFYIVRPLRGAS